MSFDVSIVPCGSYDMGEARAALSAALAPLGGLDWVRPGMKIAVKVNLISAMRPDAAATVHPALLTALTELLQERGASVVLGDSPGGLFTAAHLNRVYDVCGLRQCEQAGAALNLDTAQTEAHAPEAVQARTFTYTRWLDDADAIIDFCKLKTHGMLAMTNACKNFFGVIPGTMKPEYHCKYPKTEDFADMLVDLCEYFKPRLVLCDAVFAMEGNGPTQGHPRKVGAILAAESAHKLDLAAASLLGLTAQDVPTLAAARRRSLIPDAVDQLSVSGDLAAHRVPDFVVPSMRPDTAFAGGGAQSLAEVFVERKDIPVIMAAQRQDGIRETGQFLEDELSVPERAENGAAAGGPQVEGDEVFGLHVSVCDFWVVQNNSFFRRFNVVI